MVLTLTEKIRKLSNRDQAREKIAVWYGSADNYQHGLKELLANATDEIINNFEEGTITVKLSEDGSTVTVTDTGRGIPISGETDGIPNYELLFLTLFAGTKYGDSGVTNGTYTGSNGVGTTVLNYTSVLFEVTSIIKGVKYHIKFTNGGEVTEDLTEEKTSDIDGTTVTFSLDPTVYTKTIFKDEDVREIAHRYAVSSNKITVDYIHGETELTYHYTDLKEYYSELTSAVNTSGIVFGDLVEYQDTITSNQHDVFTSHEELTSLSIALSTSTTPTQESYLNLNYLPNGGKINEGIINGIKLYVNKYCRANNLFPKKVNSFSDSDITESFSFVAVMFSNNVEFANQTKFSTNKELYKEVAKRRVTQILEVTEIEDPKNFKDIINHLLLVQKENTVNAKHKEKLKKKLTEKVDTMSNRIDKLVDSRVHGEEAELYLAEGDSAHGSVVSARDSKFQASMPMGGKFLNVEKAMNIEDIVNNETIMNVIKALGCGIDLGKKQKDLPKFDITKLRYGKIICASDEDPDGAQIQCLIITLFYKLMPEIIHTGRLYLAQTPLFEIKLKDDSVLYAYTDEGRDEILKEQGSKVVQYTRAKGLGELDAHIMAETAMNPETRHLTRVTIEEAKHAEQAIVDWMGTNVDNRKLFISRNLNKFTKEGLE
ncbi:DNA topoisomerase II [Lactococcus phage 949]|uniref:DNA topoisomerase (ATP-hydrolyzing) n=1 Tax=Lactococcus phage 949 TaxID=881953 RepID=E0YIY1_9CAUD|nr:DNA topoisomerase II [Lactococcus phage 949]ADM73652.1 putative DNA gyrase subunit B-topoisomerase [Lactococcus phage 949]